MDAAPLQFTGLLHAERQALRLRHPGRAEIPLEPLGAQPTNEFDDQDLSATQAAVTRVAGDMEHPQAGSMCQIGGHGRGR